MQTIVLREGQLVAIKQPIPEPACGEVRVKMTATGVCHTDLHIASGELPHPAIKDLVLGHEGVGVVDALGPGVTTSKIGDMVGISWVGDTCGNCKHCISGNENFCPELCSTGCARNGTYADYVCINAAHAIPIPASLSAQKAAPILCAGVTVYKALKTSGVQAGDWVCVIGAAGGLGHLAVQYALAMGMKVAAVDVGKEKIAFLKQALKSHDQKSIFLADANEAQTTKDLISMTQGGPPGVIVTAPSHKAYQQAFEIVGRHGTIVAVAGFTQENVSLPVWKIILEGISFKGSLVGTRQDMREALQFAADGKVVCELLEFDLAEAQQVFEQLRKNLFEGRAVLNIAGHGFKEPEERKAGGAGPTSRVSRSAIPRST